MSNLKLVALGCLVGLLVLMSRPLMAQLTDSASSRAGTASLGPPRTFDRYDTPLDCANDRYWLERAYWRNRRQDTTQIGRDGRDDQPETVAAARTCVDRFSVHTSPTRDLLSLGQSYLAANQVDRALDVLHIAVERATGTPREKARLMYQAVTILLGAARPLLEPAMHYAALLDAQGATIAPERMLVHLAIADEAEHRDSVALQAAEIAAALKASQEMTGDTRKEYAEHSTDVYRKLALLKVRQNDPRAAIAALTAGRNALVPLRPAVESALSSLAPFIVPVGQPAPLIQATQWHNVEVGGTRQPAAGHVSIVVFPTPRCAECHDTYAVLRRLSGKYTANGLQIIFVARTTGYFDFQLASPDSEMAALTKYYVNDLHVPGVLAIWRTEFRRRDDGKLLVAAAPNEEAYQPQRSMQSYVVDADGTVRLVTVPSVCL